MTGAEALDIGREAIYTLILMSLPLLIVALIVGIAISLVQALTQIQEMTLTFVPKIIAMMLAAIVALPFMADQLASLTALVSDYIVGV